jgi:hypothetical protein
MVGRRYLIMDTWVRSRGSPRETYGGRSGIGRTSSTPSTLVSLSFRHLNLHSALTRRTNWRSLGTLKEEKHCFRKWRDIGQTYTDGVPFRWVHCAKRQRRAVCLLAALHVSGSCEVTPVLTSDGVQGTGPFVGSNCLEQYGLDKGMLMICSLVEV